MSRTAIRKVEASAPPARSPHRLRGELAAVFSARTLIFVGVFVALAIFFQLQSEGIFLTPRNLSLLLRQGAILAIVGSGVAMLMIMAEIDLSIGSAVFLCGVVSAKVATDGDVPILLAVLAAVGVGLLLGILQGFYVVVLGIPSFIATLAGLLAFRGIGLLWTNAATVGPVPAGFTALSEAFIPPAISYIFFAVIFVLGLVLLAFKSRWISFRRRVGQGSAADLRPAPVRSITEVVLLVASLAILAWIVGGFLGIPMALIWVGAIAIALIILMSKTTFGRASFLLGANREAAVYSGINVKRSVFIGFVIMGALYGVAGVLLTARIGSSTPGAGEFMELDAIAAAVIGGVSLRGGVGSIGGAVMGALLLTTINNGMSILNVSSFSQQVIKGLILVLALALDAYVLRRAHR